MSVQHVATSFQQIIDWVFPTDYRAKYPRAAVIAEEETAVTDLRIDPRQLRQFLKGRRLPRNRSAFRGFDSPPGRF